MRHVATLCVFLAMAVGARGENAPEINAQGNVRLFEGEYDAALERYEAASELAPDEPVLHLNKGLALARQNKDDEAIGEFSKVLASGDPALFARARYNIGLIHARRAEALIEEEQASPPPPQPQMAMAPDGQADAAANAMQALALYEKAMEANREAMRAWRADSDPRVNYAICKRRYQEIKERLEEQEQQQQDQQEGDEKNEDQEQSEDKQQESGEDQQEGDEQEQNDQQQQEENGEEQQQDQGEQQEDEQQDGEEQEQDDGEESDEEKSEEQKSSESDKQDGEQSEAQAQEAQGEESMSAEDARQVLNMLEGNDKEALGRLLRMRLGRVPNMENDW